ncbi:MAG: hypothetical protein NTZ78_10765 [Candidatus Aureabacteria bacterium]|nr:hypothetical protein [Candidatus Auribacterota bacterium]
MKKLVIIALSLIMMAGLSDSAIGGNIDSSAAPSEGSGMHTLNQVYNYLNSGTKEEIPSNFQEPSEMPGSTMKTLEEIYQDIMSKFEQCNAVPENVELGKTFFCTGSGKWGVQTGRVCIAGTPTPTPTATVTAMPWSLNETSCNNLSGWHWYSTNGRSACWSKTLADSVSWNKDVDSANPSAYTCATGYTLPERMAAAAAGQWYKIVSDVNSVAITSSDNGQSGAGKISALAIADCVDGSRDLCSTTGCLGTSWSTINSSLRTWAGATGKSALPYLGNDAGTTENNDFETACTQSSSNDLPLACATPSVFNLNHKACGDSDSNFSWTAACGYPNGDSWSTDARRGGYNSCSAQSTGGASYAGADVSFRVVVRP